MTRKVKEVLELVANSEHYFPDQAIPYKCSYFMCHSLRYAEFSELIAAKEKYLATEAIDKYLRKLCTYAGDPYGGRYSNLKEAPRFK